MTYKLKEEIIIRKQFMKNEFSDEKIFKMIETDFRFIIEWQGIEWGEAQDKELTRLQNTNKDRFRKHLEINGEISDFRYE